MNMFVLSTRYEKALSEKQHLANSVTELSAQIKNLQASNDQAYADAQAKALANMSPEKYERILVTCMLESLKQVEGIRQTVLDSFQKIEKQSDALQDINKLFSVSSDSLNTISASMNGLSSKMGNMTTNISGLSDRADHIHKFVATIASISDKTNLLALNAAIEAARAGDAGSGFSVVADGVRSLANETNKSASEVADLVGGIISSTKGAVESVNDIRHNYDNLSSGVDKLNHDYESIVHCCSSMKDTITTSSHRSFVQTVKLDHIVWKSDVYAVIYGLSNKKISDFADHTMCRLGEWYHNDGKQQFSHQRAYRNLELPHASAHINGVSALKLIAENRKEEAANALVKMEEASREVMSILDDLATY